MPLITWNESLSVHIREFDNHHKKLVTLLNGLFDDVTAKKDDALVEVVIGELIDYTKYHFAAEEKLMTKYSFPLAALHQQQHKELIAKVVDLQQQLKEGRARVDLALLNFLKEWLTKHIMGTDKKYSVFLKNKGVC
ncbi:MAG: hemerythrin family protein [Nitrospirae bacterium]|nr:hemerythrin family protein [Nitrospirota bacterium]